jgi:hypothetical protein
MSEPRISDLRVSTMLELLNCEPRIQPSPDELRRLLYDLREARAALALDREALRISRELCEALRESESKLREAVIRMEGKGT